MNYFKYFINWYVKFLIVIATICCIFGLIKYITSKTTTVSFPVEDIRIDSLKIDNAKISIKINSLDSIKNVEVIKVKSLDNDSTLDLFYKLIRE